MNHSSGSVSIAYCVLVAGLAALASAHLLPAQGGIRWTDPSRRPLLTVRENVPLSGNCNLTCFPWTLSFSGWSTSAIAPLGNSDEAVGVGVDNGLYSVRSTTSAFIRGGGGGEAEGTPWFPFQPDPRVIANFTPHAPPGLLWSGFLAPINGPIPDNDFGSLSCRLDLIGVLDWATMRGWMLNTRIGVATANAQGNATGRVFVKDVADVRLATIVHYKFDRGAGSFAINEAGIEGGAAGVGLLSRPSGGSPWTSGRFDSAMAAGTACDTGFHGDLGGRFTVAWFMRGQISNNLSPVFSLGSFACFTGGAAGNRVRCVGWGGPDLDSPVLTGGRWEHVALVVDNDRGSARWFIDGQPAPAVPITARVAIPASGTPLVIGAGNGATSRFDLDEFRLHAEGKDVVTVAAWAREEDGVGRPYSFACGANLRHEGEPARGQPVDYRIEATPGSAVGLFLGVGPTMLGAPLPIDLGFLDPGLAGCAWHCDLTASLPIVQVPASRIAVVTLNIPNDIGLMGRELYNQAIVIEPLSTRRATNAHLLSIQ